MARLEANGFAIPDESGLGPPVAGAHTSVASHARTAHATRFTLERARGVRLRAVREFAHVKKAWVLYFVGVGLLPLGTCVRFQCQELQQLEALRSHRAFVPGAAGPVAMRGRIIAANSVKSRLGRSCAAWSAEVTAQRTRRDAKGKTSTRVVSLCQENGAAPMTLASDGHEVRIDPTLPMGGKAMRVERRPAQSMNEGPCKAAREDTNPSYEESCVESGDEALVYGCLKDGLITPCNDGVDSIFVPPADDRLAPERSSLARMALAATVWLAVFAAAAGVYLASRRVDPTRGAEP